MNNVVKTLDFGIVPIRKNKKYTDGRELATIDLTDYGDNACFASIRADYRTEQPFAVLLDGEYKEIVK